MMLFSNVAIALSTLSRYKWRSFMTMLGVSIGVLSVVTIVSIGEGAKQDVLNQVSYFENEIVTIRSGAVTSSQTPDLRDVQALLSAQQTINEEDYKSIAKLKSTALVTTFNALASPIMFKDNTFPNVRVYGVDASLGAILDQNVQYGEFFNNDDNERPVAVVGRTVAENIFEDRSPIARTFGLAGQDVVIRGVFEPFPSAVLNPHIDYNNAIFVPYEFSKKISSKPINIVQIMAVPKANIAPDAYASTIEETVLKNHQGSKDFSVLTKAESFGVYETILNTLTSVVSGVAAVALLVAGVGIMNIMLVSVAERREEIGIRKAIGATNHQVLSQFLAEALLLSVFGGVLGLVLSFIANYFLRLLTPLRPIIVMELAVFAFCISIVIGIIFGVMPAIHAARKDPVKALRSN